MDLRGRRRAWARGGELANALMLKSFRDPL